MQFVFPDRLGEVPEAIAYKCFKFNWFDFHWVKKDENEISLGSRCIRSNLDDRHVPGGGGRHVSAFVSRAPPPPSRPDFLPCKVCIPWSLLVITSVSWWSMKCLRVNWLITENRRNFPSGDNCRQIGIQDTQGGQWWLSQVLPEEYKRDKIIRGKEHVKKINNTEK